MADNVDRGNRKSHANLHYAGLDEALVLVFPLFFQKRVSKHTGIPILFHKRTVQESLVVIGFIFISKLRKLFAFNLMDIASTLFQNAVVLRIPAELLREALEKRPIVFPHNIPQFPLERHRGNLSQSVGTLTSGSPLGLEFTTSMTRRPDARFISVFIMFNFLLFFTIIAF